MRILVSLLILFSFLSTSGQKTIYKKYDSEVLNDTREISIYLPKSYDKDSISNFPLAIVLDGHKLFDLYVGTSNYYSYQDNAPEQIVVGINMKDTRTKDAGYDIITSELTTDSKKFYRFIRDEIVPFMEATYKTSPFLTIVGEGLTANFITHFLQEKYSIYPTKDTWISSGSSNITNESFKDQNFGQDPILEIKKEFFNLSFDYQTRALIQFDLSNISQSIDRGDILRPTLDNNISGSKFYLRLYEAEGNQELSTEYKLLAQPISQSWDEGIGKFGDSPKVFNASFKVFSQKLSSFFLELIMSPVKILVMITLFFS